MLLFWVLVFVITHQLLPWMQCFLVWQQQRSQWLSALELACYFIVGNTYRYLMFCFSAIALQLILSYLLRSRNVRWCQYSTFTLLQKAQYDSCVVLWQEEPHFILLELNCVHNNTSDLWLQAIYVKSQNNYLVFSKVTALLVTSAVINTVFSQTWTCITT